MDTKLNSIEFERTDMRLIFGDGGTCLVPLARFPRLLNANDAERRQWEIIGAGRGIHWPLVDEDLSIPRLLQEYAAPIASGTGVTISTHEKYS